MFTMNFKYKWRGRKRDLAAKLLILIVTREAQEVWAG